MKSTAYKKSRNSKGALLLELLLVISFLAIILSVGSQAMLVSMQSGKISGERDVAMALATEGIEAVRGAAEERWQNIYDLTKTSQHYYATSTNPVGKWTIATTTQSSDEQIVMNGIVFARYIVVDNVSRNSATRGIEAEYVSDNDDPSTQKATVTVSWSGADSVVISDYFFRWRNKTCNQTGWSASGSGTTLKTCPDTSYDTKDNAITISGGSLILQ